MCTGYAKGAGPTIFWKQKDVSSYLTSFAAYGKAETSFRTLLLLGMTLLHQALLICGQGNIRALVMLLAVSITTLY